MRIKHQQNKLNRLMIYIKELQNRLFHAQSAFYVYEGLREIAAPNVVGEKAAKENVEVLDQYRNFFVISQESLRIYFFLELAKLFDSSKQSLHIDKVINYTESQINHLNVEAFKEYNKYQDRKFLEELSEEYKGVHHSDIIMVRDMLNGHKESIEKLIHFRDKWLAHSDVKKPKLPNIQPVEIKSLFKVLMNILNLLSGKLNNEYWTYSHVENDSKSSIKLLIYNLQEYEKYRKMLIDNRESI